MPALAPFVRTFVRRGLPVVIAAAAILAILRRYPPSEIAAQLRAGDGLAAAPFAFAFPVLYLLWGSLFDTLVIRTLGGPGYGTVVRGRAGTAVLMALGYTFSSGGFGVWLARQLRTAAGGAGLTLYFMLSDLTAAAILALVASTLAGSAVPVALKVIAGTIAAVQVSAMLIASRVPRGKAPSALERLFHAWQLVPPHLGLLQVAGRCANVFLVVTFTWAGAREFGIAIPFSVAAAWMPVVLFVGSLPVNVAGLGASQAVFLAAFSDWAAGAQLIAFQLLWQGMTTVAMVLRGVPFLRFALSEVAPAPATAPPVAMPR